MLACMPIIYGPTAARTVSGLQAYTCCVDAAMTNYDSPCKDNAGGVRPVLSRIDIALWRMVNGKGAQIAVQ